MAVKKYMHTCDMLVVIVAGSAILNSMTTMAQTTVSSAPEQGSSVTSATTQAQRKAAAKEARKQARARKNAELQKLESEGYQPNHINPDLSNELRNPQQKSGASSK
jgi:hypothetical protein